MKEHKKSKASGITLIALVVTIIVLLILAGVSIAMLTGENGLLTKAGDAKTRTERQSIVEQARTDVLGYQAENKGTNLQKTQLQTVLETYFKSVPDLTDMSDTEILNTKLETLAKYGTHNIAVKEIFDGTLISGPLQDTTWQEAIANRYDLDDENKTLTIKTGAPITAENVEIKKYAVIDGIKYTTKFPEQCGGLFADSSMKSLVIDYDVDMTNVTMMGGMFNNCRSLIEANLSNLNLQNVTYLNGLFNGCPSLSKVNLSNMNTSSVTDMGGMFAGCTSLTEAHLENIDTSNVTKMFSIFAACPLTSGLDLSSWNTENVSEMSGMFTDVTGKIIIGNSWNSTMTESATGYNGTFEVKNN